MFPVPPNRAHAPHRRLRRCSAELPHLGIFACQKQLPFLWQALAFKIFKVDCPLLCWDLPDLLAQHLSLTARLSPCHVAKLLQSRLFGGDAEPGAPPWKLHVALHSSSFLPPWSRYTFVTAGQRRPSVCLSTLETLCFRYVQGQPRHSSVSSRAYRVRWVPL